jgi:hypothetical protein
VGALKLFKIAHNEPHGRPKGKRWLKPRTVPCRRTYRRAAQRRCALSQMDSTTAAFRLRAAVAGLRRKLCGCWSASALSTQASPPRERQPAALSGAIRREAEEESGPLRRPRARLASAAAATSREGHRPPRSVRAGQPYLRVEIEREIGDASPRSWVFRYLSSIMIPVLRPNYFVRKRAPQTYP